MNVFSNYSKLFAYAQELFAKIFQPCIIRGMDTKTVERHFGTRETAIQEIGSYRQQWDYWVRKGIPQVWQDKIRLLIEAKRKAKK